MPGPQKEASDAIVEHLAGAAVGAADGAAVGAAVGVAVGAAVGAAVGVAVGRVQAEALVDRDGLFMPEKEASATVR